jgi:hypothetical protein
MLTMVFFLHSSLPPHPSSLADLDQQGLPLFLHKRVSLYLCDDIIVKSMVGRLRS